jgi:glycosyltransferase involved in cell wall biosynthesis
VRRLYQQFPDQPLVSISQAQRDPLPDQNWLTTVYNGIDLCSFHFSAQPGDYLVFLGRISPEKRPDRAIEIARDVGMRLIIAAKVDPADQGYYEHAIAPMIASSTLITYIGEVDERGKDELLRGAYAYLFPIDWPEPFGLTMVEAMATGTPVVAYRAGSVPEVVVNGGTGFVCESFSEMIAAIPRVATIDRTACRTHVEKHFTVAAMADGYERAYALLVGDASARDSSAEHSAIDWPVWSSTPRGPAPLTVSPPTDRLSAGGLSSRIGPRRSTNL